MRNKQGGRKTYQNEEKKKIETGRKKKVRMRNRRKE